MSFDIFEQDSFSKLVKNDSLVEYIISKLDDWERHREQNFDTRWNEYYRLWTGKWAEEDRGENESKYIRSKAIMPTSQQAVETIIAEEEEAIFGRPRWVVFQPGEGDDPEQLGLINKRLLEDLDEADVPQSISECLTNKAVYGTAIAKIVVAKEEEFVPSDLEGGIIPKDVTRVFWIPVSPFEFIIDPAAQGVNDAHGMAHVTMVPINVVLTKQARGVYDDSVKVVPWSSKEDTIDAVGGKPRGIARAEDTDMVHICEYHGLVPARFLPNQEREGLDDDDLVETIVTIQNKSDVLRAVKNPIPMKDRAFIVGRHEKIPGEFWGRGVIEKAYWPQKTLDGEIRARNDSLAFSAHPMMITNATMFGHRGTKLGIYPGRNFLANGDVNQAMAPIKFPPPDPQTYRQSADMERMIEMSTGAIQAATSPGINARNSTATGASIIQSSAIKRSKKALQNLERSFIRPGIRKTLIRYMAFDTVRYPWFDYQFKVNSTLGIMARELEQGQLVNLLQTAPPETPAYWVLLRSVYDNSSLSNREEMQTVVDAQLQQILNPPPPAPDPQLVRIQAEQERHEDKMALERAKLEDGSRQKSRDRANKLDQETIKAVSK